MKTFVIACTILVSLLGASGVAFFTYACWTVAPWHPLTMAFTAGSAFTGFWHLLDARKSIREIKDWKV